MQTTKITITRMTFAIVAIILVVGLCFTLPKMDTNKNINLSAATNTVSVSFVGFPTNNSVSPFCAVRFLKTNGTTVNAMLTANGSFNLGGVAGKLEITVPMYSKITSTLPTHIQNNCTYYIDITTSTTLSSITITYTDQGYFSSTTII